ncbi:site-2 protease family protein [Sphingomonas sp. BT-65]|uniref:site-2 protease family protein n=1 Tax=Sphingomonas sp. BT-65 TaxID=2989821 RepID=UPI0022362C98|nr:site-2 protease family protein [Sphingomonas sp. BT-65]MCW4462454.1 site-2 protease family protein [Sphingomonas sp. BT-65]
MNPNSFVYDIAVWLIPLVIAIVFHEVAHGLVARALGDPTAAERKRLSLNPLRHVDPIGTVALPLILALAKAPVFGWAKPVLVNYARLRSPRRDMMLVALAGPGMNFALALVGAVLLGVLLAVADGAQPGSLTAFAGENLLNFVAVNIFLALFNLLPIPPFDGGHVVQGLLPPPLAKRWASFGRFGFPLLFILLLVVPAIWPNANIVARLIVPPAQAVTGWYLSIAAAIAG